MIERIYILCLTIIITSEVWTITHCLGLGHETIVCTVCLSIFLCEALCIILKQQVNSNWSYSPETFDSGQKRRFDGWPWKTIGHLFCTISSFVHHFKAIDEFKLELESWNAQLASKSAISCPVWSWNLTLKNNRAPLLCCFKFCASFRSHWWIQTGATVQKRPIGVKNDDFFSRVTLKFDGWPWKTIGPLSWATSSFLHHFFKKVNSNWSYSPETAKLGFDLCDLDHWPPTLTFCIGNFFGKISWWYDERNIVKKVSQTDGQMELTFLIATWSQFKT